MIKTKPICDKYLAHCAAPLPAQIKMRSYITTTEETALIHRAEHRVDRARKLPRSELQDLAYCPVELDRFVALTSAFAPAITFLIFALWGTLTLIANMALKLTTAILFLHRGAMGSFKYKSRVTDAPLPKISIMVPLFKESAIMSHLLTTSAPTRLSEDSPAGDFGDGTR